MAGCSNEAELHYKGIATYDNKYPQTADGILADAQGGRQIFSIPRTNIFIVLTSDLASGSTSDSSKKGFRRSSECRNGGESASRKNRWEQEKVQEKKRAINLQDHRRQARKQGPRRPGGSNKTS